LREINCTSCLKNFAASPWFISHLQLLRSSNEIAVHP
jgi:hypothetical protein